MVAVSGFANIQRALAAPNYGYYTIGNVVNTLGTWVQRTAVGWLAWDLTHSGFWLGMAAFADMFPVILLAPLTGAVADRVDRMMVIRLSQVIAGLIAATLAGLTVAGLITIELLILLVALQGTAVAFNQPVRLALVPSLVPPAAMSSAIAINSLVFNISRFVGPMIAGIILVQLGAGFAFVLNAVSYFIFVATLYMIRVDGRAPGAGEGQRRRLTSDIAGGFAYAVRHPGIGPVLVILTCFSLFARPFVELLAGFADAVFDSGPAGLSWMLSSIGLGAMVASYILASRGPVIGLTRFAVGSILAFSISLLLFAATNIFWFAIPCLLVSGFTMSVVGVGEQTLIQTAVDPAMRGRMMALYGMINRGGPAFGALAMGSLSSLVGLQVPVAAGAVLCLALWFWARPRVHTLAGHLEIEPEARPAQG